MHASLLINAAANALRAANMCAKASHASDRDRDATNDLVTRRYSTTFLRPRASGDKSAGVSRAPIASHSSMLVMKVLSSVSIQPACPSLYLVVERLDERTDFLERLQAVPMADALHNL